MKKIFTLLTLLVAVCTGAWADTAVISWYMGTNGAAASSANSITGASGCAAEGFAIAITGNTGKNWSSGNGDITYSATTYKTLKNSNGAQNTITCPAGKVATQVVFYAVTNDDGTEGKLSEIDGTSCNDAVSSLKDYDDPTVITKSINNKSSFTFTFGTKQVCFIAVVTYEDAASDVVANPQFSQTGNDVTLTCGTTGAKIYYTTDGSAPTTLSTLYSSAITLDNSCTIRAKAFNGPSNEYSSEIVKRECYVSHSSVSKYLTSLGHNGGTVSGDVWTGTNFTITNNVEGRGINSVNLAGTGDGFKLNHTDSYTIQPSDGIKVTKLVVVGKTWLQGDAGNASTIAFDDWTPASGTFFDYLTDGETYVKTIEFTPSTEQTFGQAITMRPGNNQLGAYIEVYGDLKTYTITYNNGGGTGSIPDDVKTYGQNFTLSSSTFTRDGYIQTGWKNSSGDQVYALGGTYTNNADITLYPVWVAGTETTVTYNLKTNSSSTTLDNCTSATPESGDIVASTTINKYGTADCDGSASAKTNETQKLKIDAEYTAANYYEWTFTVGSNANFTPTQVVMKFQAVSDLTQYKVELTNGTTSHTTNFVQTTAEGGTLETLTWKITPRTAFAAGSTGKLKLWAYKKNSGATAFRLGSPITIKGVVEHNTTVNITPAYDKTTYITTYAMDFSGVAGLTAYVATDAKTAGVTMTPVTTVPAGTPLLLVGTASTDYNVPVIASASAPATNYLQQGDGTTVFDGSTYEYILGSDGKFHQINSGTVATTKAYLHLDDAPSGARELSIIFDDETTGVNDVRGQKEEVRGDFFDLQGRKVAQPTKSLYIVNGKKVIVK